MRKVPKNRDEESGIFRPDRREFIATGLALATASMLPSIAFGASAKQPLVSARRKLGGKLEVSDLDYTILRPAWLNDRDEIAFGTTQKGEPFKAANESVSRKSVADLVVKLATTPDMEVRHSLGVHNV